MYTMLIIPLAIAYLPLYIGFVPSFSLNITSIYGFVVTIIIGLLSNLYITKYKKYKEFANDNIKKENIFLNQEIVANANFASVQINDKKFSEEELKSKEYNEKTGYEYLNALFFKRHEKIINRPVKITLIIISIIIVAVLAFCIGMPDSSTQRFDFIKNKSAIIVFIMYMISVGQKFANSLFYNCDKSLLRYRYYREAKTIFSNFKIRLKKLVILNILPAILICVGITLVMFVDGNILKILELVPLFITIISLSCFFSVHHMVVYYIFQPYTQELTVKSPMYSIINGVIYFISYMCLQIKEVPIYFSFVVISITIIYMIIGLILTYKLAPKTFKLRT